MKNLSIVFIIFLIQTNSNAQSFNYIDDHCFVLNHCDDIFEGTLLITKSNDGEIQFSASGIEDHDEMMDMLASCIFKIKGID